MSMTLTFFALDADGAERVLRRTVIPDDALTVYQASPAIALTIAQGGTLLRPDGFRITDEGGRVRISFSQGRRAPGGEGS